MVAADRDVAEAFVEARKRGQALPSYPGEKPADLPAAYRIQDAALALWDRPVGGWKVGKIGPPLDAQLGANRLAGPIFTDVIFKSSGEPLTMPVFPDGFAAAEAEFMLRLSPPAADGVPATNDEARGWVDEIRLGIEIASSPYPGINADGPCVTVSDHGNNHGIVLGDRIDPSDWDRLDAVEVELAIDGAVAGRATTATMLDGPFGAVRFLLENLANRGIAPQAGWWVSSGAVTGVHEVERGAQVRAVFNGLGVVELRIS